MIKYIKIVSFTLILVLLAGCSGNTVENKVYATDNFEISVPIDWAIEEGGDILPDNVITTFMYKDIETKDIYTVNIIGEEYSSDVMSFVDRSLGMVNSSEGYELIDSEEITLGDTDALFHFFRMYLAKQTKKVMQVYIYDQDNSYGYVLTGISPNKEDNEVNENTLRDILESFVLKNVEE